MGFFDKLKSGGEDKPAPKPKEAEKKKTKTSASAKSNLTMADKSVGKRAVEDKEEQLPEKQLKQKESDFEGELTIDVYETDEDFVVQSTIAGVKAEDLDISIENDIVTIRGSREKHISGEAKKYYYQECYWGAFSRQVILPEEVDGSKAEASLKDGVLTLKIPKVIRIQKRKIAIKQES